MISVSAELYKNNLLKIVSNRIKGEGLYFFGYVFPIDQITKAVISMFYY